jgi:hypothetical protein
VRGLTVAQVALAATLAVLMLISCGKKKNPSRDHYPILHEKLVKLQAAVIDRNRAAIDSLMSTVILDNGQSSDSLLNFVYGADRLLGFTRFGDYQIAYTDHNAQIECFIMDSTGERDRPLVLLYGLNDRLWLLEKFKVGPAVVADSASS